MSVVVEISTARLSDASLLAELGASTFVDTFAADNTPEDMASYVASAFTPEKIASEIERGHVFFIARVSGAPAGYVKIAPGEPPGCVLGPSPVELARLYVVRDFHGRGVARELMEACVGEARGRGYRTLWLGVWERNPRAQSFYKKSGFADVGSQPFVLGSDVQTDRVFARAID